MPSLRLGNAEQMNLALDDLVRLGSLVDELSIVITGPDQVSLHHEDGAGRPVKVLTSDAMNEVRAKQLVTTSARGDKIVVANRITEPARKYLASQRWSWLDRRIGAHIAMGRRDVEIRYAPARNLDGRTRDGDTSPALRLGGSTDAPLRGRAGIAYAAALLCSPNDPPSFRSIAATVNMSPTAISNAVKRLAAAGLVAPDNTPTLPELFWALADVWNPLKAVAVASAPNPSDAGVATRMDQPGWVLGGDLAAAELGAPLFSVETPPWLWVPTQVELRRAERTYGAAAWSDRAAIIAAPPTPLVCRWRRPPAAGGMQWPLPHPVFAALDLARDPGRGREILAKWTPEEVDDVWH